jgi:hypothetical protein
MVLVNIKVSDCPELEIEGSVVRKQFQHVIEKANAG